VRGNTEPAENPGHPERPEHRGHREHRGLSEQPEPPEPPASSAAWRFGLDFEDSVVALRHPPGLENVAKALEWYFEGLPHEEKAVVTDLLPMWHRLRDERGPHYSLSTNSAEATRLDQDGVELMSSYGHFETVVISNAMFEEAVSAYQDFVEHDDRYK
jgi:hypothetical protein